MAFIGGRFASMLHSEEGENAGKRPSASYARSRPLARPTPHDLPAAIQKIRAELKILTFQTLTYLTYILQLGRPTKFPALFLYLLYIIARCDSPRYAIPLVLGHEWPELSGIQAPFAKS